MSALAGVQYRDDRPVSPDTLRALAFRNHVRGPHRTSQYVAIGVASLHFAHHFDGLAAAETQPTETAEGMILTWDGRLDNRDDLQLQLCPRTPLIPDAQLVGRALDKWNLDALPRLVGDWSLAILRPRERTLFLARDFAGTRPLHYCCTAEGVFWSTCLETLVALLDRYAAIDEVYLAQLLSAGPDNERTPFRDCRSVPSAHVVTFRPGQEPVSRRYWDFPVSTVRYKELDTYREHLRSVFKEAVAVRLRGVEPYWCELSGGLDSTAVLCMAEYLCRSASRGSIRPVSFVCPDAPESDERPWIAIVEEHLSLKSRQIPCSTNVNAATFTTGIRPLNADPWIRKLDDWVGHSKGYLVLTGALGDLVMAKNSRNVVSAVEHLQAGSLKRFWAAAWHWSRRTRTPVWHILLDVLVNAYARRDGGWLKPRVSTADPSNSTAAFGMSLKAQMARTILTPRYAALVPTHPAMQPNVAHFPPAKRHLASGLYTLTGGHRLECPDDLPHIRFAHPYAHRPLTEFVLGIPQHVLWQPGLNRSLMRMAFDGFMPARISRRQNKGYASPFVKGLADSLMRGLLADASGFLLVRNGIVDQRRLDARVDALRTGRGVDLVQALQLASTELWLRRLVTGQLSSREAAQSRQAC